MHSHHKHTNAHTHIMKLKPSLFFLYSFNRNKKWRRSPLSPNSKNSKTLKAKTWKNNDDRIALRNFLFQNLTRKHAPEAQLLELLQSRGAPIPTMKMTKNKGVYSMPKEGEATLPMTLADGTRVYVRMRSCGERKDAIDGESSSSLSSSSSSSLFSSSTPVGRSALGVSMRELKRRADAIRRKQGRQRSSNESRRIVDDGQLWVDKHAPSSFPHLLSDERTNREVLRALRAWDPYVFGRDPPSRPAAYSYHAEDKGEGQPNATETTTQQHDQRPEEASRVILLSGPPGVGKPFNPVVRSFLSSFLSSFVRSFVRSILPSFHSNAYSYILVLQSIGKTTLAHILARHAGYRPLEVNGSDERSAAVLTDRVRRAMESNTIQMNPNDGKGKPNCLILDEIDGADAKGAIQSLVEIIRAELPPKGAKQKNPYLRRPIIFICNHKYAPALRPLLPYAKHFNVNPPSPTRLVARLKAVLSKEKLSMMAGGSLLHQLVVSTGGDIRSCLYTLQFAAAQASDSHEFAQALASSLGGTGLKDDRSDISTTITAVFRKFKTNRLAGIGDDRAGVARVFNAVEGFGDNPGTINSLFMNLLRVSYIDPTFDRCSAAHDWLSGADLFCSHKLGLGNEADQYTMQRLHTPSVAAAIHLLCRVELKPDLSFSTREIMDAHYQREANVGLVHKFSEGLPPKAKSAKCQDLLSTEFIPMILWILSAGTGNSSLSRAASSIDVLTKLEKLSVEEHVAILRSLGLTYVADQDPLAPRSKEAYMDGGSKKMRLEPPIDRLVHFQQLNMPNGLHRHEIPSAVSYQL